MKLSRQPEVNIGMIGHVDHGKTTLTKTLTGEWTDRHSEEIKMGISIKLGYADAMFYKCPQCMPSVCYSTKSKCRICGSKTERLRAVSFVDAPGHETLMAIMISGAALMDGAILLIAANEPCPQPQTKEHLTVLNLIGAKNIVIVQNKIDLMTENECKIHYEQIKKFVKGTSAEGSPIIPISAHHDINIDVLIEAIEKYIPTPERESSKPARAYIARSFDINKPGTKPRDLKGGVLGGSLIWGKLKIADELEIRPGIAVGGKKGSKREPIFTKVETLISGGKKFKRLTSGGLIGIGTTLDPSLTKSDGLTGNVAGIPGSLPPVWNELNLEIHLLERLVGSSEGEKIGDIKIRENLMLSVGTTITVGNVTALHKKNIDVTLRIPVCADVGERVAISRRFTGRWHIIGYGVISSE